MSGRRPLVRTKEDRISRLQKDINRSGFTVPEVFQIMVEWYGYREAVLYRGLDREVISNSFYQGDGK